MSIYIDSKYLKTVFRMEMRDSVQKIWGTDSKNLTSGFSCFNLTPHRIKAKKPSLEEKINIMEKVLPVFIDSLKQQNQCVIQLCGTIEEGKLAGLSPFTHDSDSHRRFYWPEISQFGDFTEDFHYESMVQFNFDMEFMQTLPIGESDVIVRGIIIERSIPELADTFFNQKWWAAPSICQELNKCNSFFETDSDFEYLEVGTKFSMEELAKIWQKGLERFDDGCLG